MIEIGVLFDQVIHLCRYHYGWTKAYLTLFFAALSPLCAEAASSVEVSAPATVELVLLGKLALPLAVAILANAAIPAFKYYYNQYKLKKSYLIYIRANVRSTLFNYGVTKSIDDTIRDDLDGQTTQWSAALASADLDVPELIYSIHLAFKKASEEESVYEGYIPYVSYAGMPIPSDLDHEHPIWTMKKADTRHIADFLLSQSQVEKSIAQHYVDPLFSLATSSNRARRQQWIEGGYLIVNELTQHYINTMRLKKHLMV